MKRTIILGTTLLMMWFNRAQAQCQGDCNNGYGTLVEGNTTTTGFFKNSKLDGLGDIYGENMYSGQWKEGKKEGFVVYKEGNEGISYGMFVNDLKQGLHVTPLEDGSIRAETFDKGVSKDKNAILKTGDAACPYGNCQNGIGVKVETTPDGQTLKYIGNFVNGVLEGPGHSQYSNSENKIYATFKAGIMDGFMLYVYPTGGVTLSEMHQGKRHGRLINIFPDGKSAAYFFENDAPVKK